MPVAEGLDPMGERPSEDGIWASDTSPNSEVFLVTQPHSIGGRGAAGLPQDHTGYLSV